MITTKNDIGQWFEEGVENEFKYMAVIGDYYNDEDYPKFFKTYNELQETVKNPGNMQKIMETYDLSKDMWEQLNNRRNFV